MFGISFSHLPILLFFINSTYVQNIVTPEVKQQWIIKHILEKYGFQMLRMRDNPTAHLACSLKIYLQIFWIVCTLLQLHVPGL